MGKFRTIGKHRFKKEHTFATKKEATEYVSNARSYGEQVRIIKTSKGYEVWGRIGDYAIEYPYNNR